MVAQDDGHLAVVKRVLQTLVLQRRAERRERPVVLQRVADRRDDGAVEVLDVLNGVSGFANDKPLEHHPIEINKNSVP